jgi:hypothetical protein
MNKKAIWGIVIVVVIAGIYIAINYNQPCIDDCNGETRVLENKNNPGASSTPVVKTEPEKPAQSAPVSTTPSIKVLSPNGGENIISGRQYSIIWKNNDASMKVNILLERYDQNNNLVVSTSIAQAVDNTGTYNWNTIALDPGPKNKIRITGASGTGTPKPEDSSDGYFTISSTKPTINVISPKASVSFSSNYPIIPFTWNASYSTKDVIVYLWPSQVSLPNPPGYEKIIGAGSTGGSGSLNINGLISPGQYKLRVCDRKTTYVNPGSDILAEVCGESPFFTIGN